MLVKKIKDSRQILAEKDIFVWPSPEGYKYHVVYAPLADSAFLASGTNIESLALAVQGDNSVGEPYTNIVEDLLAAPVPNLRDGYIRDEKDFVNLSILPNNTCNFTCSYCYSAKGRSSACLTYDVAQRMILYFFDSRRDSHPQLLTFSIFGGGEPLLSWHDVVRPAISLIMSEAKKRQQKIVVTLITNGSLLPGQFVETCKMAAIDLVVSFDILEDVQNRQRRHYASVVANIRRLIDSGIVPAINAVITDLNVERQTEMIEQLHQLFPEIKYAAFEPMFGEITDKDKFYRAFSRSFIGAQQLADQYGIHLSCTVLRNVDVTVDRYCPGEMALCADGSITICPCVSSPLESNYNKYIYGKVTEQDVMIDNHKLALLLAQNVHSNECCRQCFAKWNCGGGCMNENINNGGKPIPAYCKFVRNMTRYIITRRLDRSYQEDNTAIRQYIGDYEQIIG